MLTTSKWVGLLAVAFVAGSFVASPELRAYAANTVFSTDIVDGQVMTADLAGNSVTSAKIKDGEVKTDDIAAGAIGSLRIKDNDVKAQDLAPDSVGASEIQGVTKLIFSKCSLSTSTSIPAGGGLNAACNVTGAVQGDTAMGLITSNTNGCLVLSGVVPTATPNLVSIFIRNTCTTQQTPLNMDMSIIVFHI